MVKPPSARYPCSASRKQGGTILAASSVQRNFICTRTRFAGAQQTIDRAQFRRWMHERSTASHKLGARFARNDYEENDLAIGIAYTK
jgi:hypothetical protein